jgi:uncharacterized protein (TIGR02421 family)
MASADWEPISGSVIQSVRASLAENRPVRQVLPGGGLLNLDRLLPFLCVYRRDPRRHDRGTDLFVTAEAAYLCAPGEALRRRGLRELVRAIAAEASSRLGSFLLLEIWSQDDREVPRGVDELTGEPLLPPPGFRILARSPHRPEGTVETLDYSLQRIKIHRQAAQVTIARHTHNHPPGMGQLLSVAAAQRMNCHVLGLEIGPVYRDPETGEVYQKVLRGLRRGVTRALKQAFFTFALNRTNFRPQHYYVLGRKTLPQHVWHVDYQLAKVSDRLKFLLLVTPVNAERSWHAFADRGYTQEPQFQYRPMELDPLMLKRELLNIRTERIEDPTLAHVLRQTQDEIDRQITMLLDIGTRRFLPGSLQVFGRPDGALVDLAAEILRRVPAGSDPDRKVVTAREFARQAAREIAYYRRQMADFAGKAVVCDDMYSGLLSTGGNLMIGRETTIAARRVEALLQHEVGTHLVTYYNGGAQPLRLLQIGLAGYDRLQEGLAVLAEYLFGGLSRGRLRTLAARVLATDLMARGVPFVQTFRALTQDYAFEPRPAYTVALRVYRGGGLTKDAVYLKGLVEILDYVRRGGEMELLAVGKVAADHIPVVRELLLRGVLRDPPLRPRWLDHPPALARLERLRRANTTVLDLLES